MMKTKTWYRKIALDNASLAALKVTPKLWSLLAEKLHEDNVNDIAVVLGLTPELMLLAMYKPCEDPSGFLGRYN